MEEKLFKNLIKKINVEDFKIPIEQPIDSYFPNFLEDKLDEYETYYLQHIDHIINEKFIIEKIKKVNIIIKKSINLYYSGKISEASKTFKSIKQEIGGLLIPQEEKGTLSFYRARQKEDSQFSTSDLFHINFKIREIISTNRYSIPGFPALYLGDSSYVCWEEFNRPKFETLSFVRIENTRPLKFYSILRIQDCIKDLQGIKDETLPNGPIWGLKETGLLCYLASYPLVIASSIKVKIKKGNFKPEYIIPQMLLELVCEEDDIDGIKFLSTKVDYDSLLRVDAYNYVFPIKKSSHKGFCPELLETFHSTEPTSWEIEQLSGLISIVHNDDDGQIELIKDESRHYPSTTFGQLESRLKNRVTKKYKTVRLTFRILSGMKPQKYERNKYSHQLKKSQIKIQEKYF